ncbi:hypothetical protein B0A75_11395 [Flavobacterium oncorhynchi]|uniref:Uncharacterized protein n=1 Tax=Flavobacterium oncorhynchi TaxID=728056 RepID=A0A226HYM6_9FLAO|nr:hypothetical protein [Flavobacterium oncorhynchi]OXA99407.1 hypothetical protein B0A75_11395 [Flavobacterium oncorhynchi]
MSVKIIPLTEHKQDIVNRHLFYKNVFENRIFQYDLFAAEHETFANYEKLVIEDSILKKNRSYILESGIYF